MKTIIIVSSLFFTVAICNGQDYSPTRFLWPANLSFNPYSYYSYDIQANELGINVAYDDAGTLKYVLLGVSGNILRQSTIATGYSLGWLRPAITSVKKGVREDIFIFWRHSDSIKVSMSTDGGKSWAMTSSLWAKSNAASNMMDAVSNGDSVHVTWDTGGNSYSQTKVHYALLNISGYYPFWSDEYTSTFDDGINGVNVNGHFPKIAIVPKSNTVNIVYVTRKLENERPYDRLVHRAKGVNESAWDSVDVIYRLHPDKETMYTVIGSQHERQVMLSLSVSVYDSNLICGFSRYNTQPTGGTFTEFKYCEVFREYIDRISDTLMGGSVMVGFGPSEQYSNGQSILFSEDSIYCTWKYDTYPNILHVIKSQAADTLLTLSESPFSMLTKNSFSKLLMIAQFGSSMGGYRIPRDLTADIIVNTYFTSKTRIGKTSDISLDSGVTAVVYDTLALDTSSTLHVRGTLTCKGIIAIQKDSKIIVEPNGKIEIDSSARIIVYDGGQLQCNSNGIINMNNGIVEFENSASAIIHDEYAFRGTGIFIKPTIHWSKDFTINDTTAINCQNGGHLILNDSSQTHYINISGDLVFDGETAAYWLEMSNQSMINVLSNGLLQTNKNTKLIGIPNLQAYYPSDVNSYGLSGSTCDWQFKKQAPCDIYGNINAQYTHFHGITEQDTVREWQGILVGYEDAKIDLSNCEIDDIYTNNPSGSAVHLYEANNPNNIVASSSIRRLADARRGNGDPKAGDGVFMQPGLVSIVYYAYRRFDLWALVGWNN